MGRRGKSTVWTCVVVVSLWMHGAAGAATVYSFGIAAETGQTVIDGRTLSSIELQQISLNNNGQIAFSARFSGLGGRAVTTLDRVVAKSGDVFSGITLNEAFASNMNEGGRVTFAGLFAGPVGDNFGLFDEGGLVARKNTVIGGVSMDAVFIPSHIDNAGQVYFVANTSDIFGGPSVMSSTARILHFDDVIDGKRWSGATTSRPHVSGNGTVAIAGGFRGTASNPGNGSGIFALGATTGLIVETGDTFGGETWSGRVSKIALNDNDFFAWFGNIQSGGNALFSTDGLIARNGDTIGGKQILLLNSNSTGFGPDTNNSRQVVYPATISGGSAILSNTGLSVGTGDTIAGKTLSTIVTHPVINDLGQVAFIGNFTGGTAIFLASPVTGGPIINGGFESPGLADWTVEGPGTAGDVEFPAASGNTVAQLTAGSPVTLSQVVDTPPVPFTLEFDHRFDTITGSLDVLIDFQLVDTITAPASLVDDLTHHVIPIAPLSGLIGLEDVQLAFRMDGGAGDTVLLDNIMFVPEPAVGRHDDDGGRGDAGASAAVRLTKCDVRHGPLHPRA